MTEPLRVDPLAAEGFTAGAEAYERGRPGYPDAAIDWAFRELGLGSGARVLDLGAGTGKLTRSLVGRAAEVVAVEPLDAMRAELARVLPSARAIAGVAEAIPLADGSVDAVLAGEAFHWFDLEPTLAEIRRVLLPGGGLAVLWNVVQWDGPWAREVGEAIARHRDSREHPFSHRPSWTMDDRMHDRSDLTPLRSESFPHEQRATAAGLLDIVASMSFIAALAPEARAAALADVAAALERHGADDLVLQWRCDVYVTRRVD